MPNEEFKEYCNSTTGGLEVSYLYLVCITCRNTIVLAHTKNDYPLINLPEYDNAIAVTKCRQCIHYRPDIDKIALTFDSLQLSPLWIKESNIYGCIKTTSNDVDAREPTILMDNEQLKY